MKNLVLLIADQLPYRALGFAGDSRAQTARLDTLAAESVNLTNACSGHPLGGPFRASMLTGRFSTSTGMVMNALRLNPAQRTLAHILGERGYETAFIGKWNLYADKLGANHKTRDSFVPPGPYRLGFNGYFAAYDYHHSNYAPGASYYFDTPEKRFPLGYEPDHQTDLAIERLRTCAESGTPFALIVSYGAPHDPWKRENLPVEYYARFADTEFALPENYSKKNDPYGDSWARMSPKDRAALPEWMRCHAAMTANLSDNAGRVWDALCDAGLAENTVFTFTADHGEMMGAHGRREKNCFYDEAVHVPFLLRLGGSLPAGANPTPFGTVDILPTLLSLMDIGTDGEAFEGADLSAAIRSGETGENACLLMGTGPTAVWGANREWRALRNTRYTYAVYRSDRSEYLFDDAEDPLQMRNLAQEEAFKPVLREMKDELFARMSRIGDDFEPNAFYRKNWADGRTLRERRPTRREAGAKR